MCRDDNHGGRRCPADTSEARQLRRKNSAARSGYASLAVEPVESKALPVVPVNEVTVETVKAEIEGLHALREEFRRTHLDKDTIQKAYDNQLNAIGAAVSQLAEEKYGAPTDEELRNVHDAAEKKVMEAADARKAELQIKVEAAQAIEDELKAKLYEIASPDSHPNGMELTRAWRTEAPETYQAWSDAKYATFAAEVDVKLTHRNVATDTMQAVREGLEKRNVAIKEALTAAGVEFADPDSLKFSEDSHKDAVTSLKKAIEYFPQTWVNNSNAYHSNTEMRVKRSKGRAHYSTLKEQTKRINGTKANIEVHPESWEPDTSTLEGMEYVDMKGEKVWVDPVSGHRQRAVYVPEGNKTWARITYDYSDTPKKGWEQVEYMKTEWSRADRGLVKTGEKATTYRKIKKAHISTTWERKAELTVTRDFIVRVGEDRGFRVAMHEFAHRVEHTTPGITGYEDAFLRRRAGHFSEEPESLTAIYEGKKEMGYADNFTNHYMGKVYDDSFREILSMGMESLFAGTNGGFAGLEGRQPDPDYKKFILGVLASSAKRES